MTFRFLVIFALATAMFMLPVAADAVDVKFYVSTDGNDSWSGTRPQAAQGDGPFRTLERARDAIRQRKQVGSLPAGAITVELSKGIYCLDKELFKNNLAVSFSWTNGVVPFG